MIAEGRLFSPFFFFFKAFCTDLQVLQNSSTVDLGQPLDYKTEIRKQVSQSLPKHLLSY